MQLLPNEYQREKHVRLLVRHAPCAAYDCRQWLCCGRVASASGRALTVPELYLML